MYVTLSNSDKCKLLSSVDTESYSLQGHQFVPLKGIGKSYCKSCGLVALSNKATNWCIQKGCKYDLHAQYKNAMRRFSKK